MANKWTFAMGAGLIIFVMGWALPSGDRFGFIVGVVLITGIYLLSEHMEKQ